MYYSTPTGETLKVYEVRAEGKKEETGKIENNGEGAGKEKKATCVHCAAENG